MASFSVTTSFVVNTRIKSAEVNQNFTDVLNILKGHHHDPNIYPTASQITTSGIAPNAQIADTQLRSQITRSGLVNQSALGSITQAGLIARSALPVAFPFGGTGADGAQSISSGTTDIDVGGAMVYILNYTSLSITGTGALTFSNPHSNGTIVVIKVQGNGTVTSSATAAIDVKGMGAASSTRAISNLWFYGANAGGAPSAGSGNNGTGGAAVANNVGAIAGKIIVLGPGAGGGASLYDAGTNGRSTGGGGASLVSSGTNGSGAGGGSFSPAGGGRGGGALYLEIGGIWNCTGTIRASGNNGTQSSAGGGGGCIVVCYNAVSTDTGTYTVAGGTGDNSIASIVGGNGGTGYSLRFSNQDFT